jgi:hypothetical protein
MLAGLIMIPLELISTLYAEKASSDIVGQKSGVLS